MPAPVLVTLVLTLAVNAPPGQEAMEARVRAVIAGFPGTVSLCARNLDTGVGYALGADQRIRSASTIKVPVMVAAFAAVHDRHARWTQKLRLRDREKVSGSGVLFEFSSGSRFPIRDLVHLMIVISDNTATNLLIDRFSADFVNQQMDKLGLSQTRLMRKVRGDGTNLKAPSGWSKAGLLKENQRFGLGVTTPREMVALLEKLERGEVVSPAASREMIEILKRQQLKDGIGRRLTTPVASKSGSLDALRSDVGIVYSPGGRIAMAITVDGMSTIDYSPDNAGNLLIWRLAQILLEGLAKR